MLSRVEIGYQDMNNFGKLFSLQVCSWSEVSLLRGAGSKMVGLEHKRGGVCSRIKPVNGPKGITEITRVSNVYLKILDKLIILRCSQKMHICSEEE